MQPTGDMVPPSQLAKRSCLAHQNNAWKSIKVDGTTLDAWVTRLQDEVEGEDGPFDPHAGAGGSADGGYQMQQRNAADYRGARTLSLQRLSCITPCCPAFSCITPRGRMSTDAV